MPPPPSPPPDRKHSDSRPPTPSPPNHDCDEKQGAPDQLSTVPLVSAHPDPSHLSNSITTTNNADASFPGHLTATQLPQLPGYQLQPAHNETTVEDCYFENPSGLTTDATFPQPLPSLHQQHPLPDSIDHHTTATATATTTTTTTAISAPLKHPGLSYDLAVIFPDYNPANITTTTTSGADTSQAAPLSPCNIAAIPSVLPATSVAAHPTTSITALPAAATTTATAAPQGDPADIVAIPGAQNAVARAGPGDIYTPDISNHRDYSFASFGDPDFLMPHQSLRERLHDWHLWFKSRPFVSFNLLLAILFAIFVGLLLVMVFVAYPDLMSQVVSQVDITIDTIHIVPPPIYYSAIKQQQLQLQGESLDFNRSVDNSDDNSALSDLGAINQLKYVPYIASFLGEVVINAPLSTRFIFTQPIVITWKNKQVGLIASPPDIIIKDGRGSINWTAVNMLTVGQDFDAKNQRFDDLLSTLNLNTDHLWTSEMNTVDSTPDSTSLGSSHLTSAGSDNGDGNNGHDSDDDDDDDDSGDHASANSDEISNGDRSNKSSEKSTSVAKGVSNLNKLDPKTTTTTTSSSESQPNPALWAEAADLPPMPTQQAMPNVNGRAFAMTPHLQDQYTGDGGIIMDMRSGPEIIANSNNSGGGGDSGSSPSTVLNLFNWLTAIQNGQPLSMAWSSELMVKNLGLEANHLIMQEQIFIPCRDVAKCSLVDFLDNSTLQHSSYNTNRDEL